MAGALTLEAFLKMPKKLLHYFWAGFIATAGITQLLVTWQYNAGMSVWANLFFVLCGVFLCAAAIGAALLYIQNHC